MKIGVFAAKFTVHVVTNKYYTDREIYDAIKDCKNLEGILNSLMKLMGDIILTNNFNDFTHQIVWCDPGFEFRTKYTSGMLKKYIPEPQHKVVKFKYIGGSSPEYVVAVSKECSIYLEGEDVVEKQYKKFTKKNIRNLSVVL